MSQISLISIQEKQDKIKTREEMNLTLYNFTYIVLVSILYRANTEMQFLR